MLDVEVFKIVEEFVCLVISLVTSDNEVSKDVKTHNILGCVSGFNTTLWSSRYRSTVVS